MPKIKLGFVGSGGIARMHARGLLRHPDLFTINAAADQNAERLDGFCAEFAISVQYSDYHLLTGDPELDAVIILLPHNLHEEACLAAFSAGKHVLLEKPIARSLEEADRIIAAAHRAGKTLMVGHNQRYEPWAVAIKAMVDDRVLGRLFTGRADHYQNFNPPENSWWRSKDATGGGCVIGSGIHRLDLLRWYLGEVEEVFAYQVGEPDRLEAEVASVATLRFRSGAIGEFYINWGVYNSPSCETLSLTGKDGAVWARDGAPLRVINHRLNPSNNLDEVICDPEVESMWSYFHRCIESSQIPLTFGQEGRASLALVLAINQSATSGLPVRLA